MTILEGVAIFFLLAFITIGVAGVIIFERELKEENQINRARYEREKYWHDQEEENWRYVDPALQKRIKELEATCKDNQRVIANLRLEILNKDQFLAAFKLKDLYDQGYFPTNKN